MLTIVYNFVNFDKFSQSVLQQLMPMSVPRLEVARRRCSKNKGVWRVASKELLPVAILCWKVSDELPVAILRRPRCSCNIAPRVLRVALYCTPSRPLCAARHCSCIVFTALRCSCCIVFRQNTGGGWPPEEGPEQAGGKSWKIFDQMSLKVWVGKTNLSKEEVWPILKQANQFTFIVNSLWFPGLSKSHSLPDVSLTIAIDNCRLV